MKECIVCAAGPSLTERRRWYDIQAPYGIVWHLVGTRDQQSNQGITRHALPGCVAPTISEEKVSLEARVWILEAWKGP